MQVPRGRFVVMTLNNQNFSSFFRLKQKTPLENVIE